MFRELYSLSLTNAIAVYVIITMGSWLRIWLWNRPSHKLGKNEWKSVLYLYSIGVISVIKKKDYLLIFYDNGKVYKNWNPAYLYLFSFLKEEEKYDIVKEVMKRM